MADFALEPGEDYLLTVTDFGRRDVRKLICVNGLQTKAEKYGWDWKGFLHNGIMASELLKANDGSITRVVEVIVNGRRG